MAVRTGKGHWKDLWTRRDEKKRSQRALELHIGDDNWMNERQLLAEIACGVAWLIKGNSNVLGACNYDSAQASKANTLMPNIHPSNIKRQKRRNKRLVATQVLKLVADHTSYMLLTFPNSRSGYIHGARLAIST